jgi:hypothetical protein
MYFVGPMHNWTEVDNLTRRTRSLLRDVCTHGIALYGCRADGRIAFQPIPIRSRSGMILRFRWD